MNKHEQASELVSKIDLSDNNTDRAQSKLTDLDSESINDRDPELAVLFIYVGPYQTMLSSFPRVKHTVDRLNSHITTYFHGWNIIHTKMKCFFVVTYDI